MSVITYLGNQIEQKVNLSSLLKQLAVNLLKNLVDIMLSKKLSNNCLKCLKSSLLKLLNYSEVSNDAKIVFELTVLLKDYCKSGYEEKHQFYSAVLTVFEAIVACESVIPSNSNMVLKSVLEGVKSMLDHVFSRLQKLTDLRSELEILIKK